MCSETLTDFERLLPPPPPTTTMLAGDDEFDPRSSGGQLLFCWCFGALAGELAPDTKHLLSAIERYARDEAAAADLEYAMHAAKHDATAEIGGPVHCRTEFLPTMLSVRAARLVVRFAEAIFGRDLRTAPSFSTQLAELVLTHRTGQPIISVAKVDAIEAEFGASECLTSGRWSAAINSSDCGPF